jgi:chaperonin GroEL
MPKTILFDQNVTEKIKSGLHKLSKAVAVTLGPAGNPVILGKKYGSSQITKDGVTIAREIELEDPIENLAVQLVKEVATKTNDKAGDGTTTATVLAQAIFTEGIKNITAGANATEVARGIHKAVEEVIKDLKRQARHIDTQQEIQQIAKISANNDEKIGKMVADALQKVGKKGVITVEEAKGTDTSVRVVEGMQFSNGYISPHFVTNTKKMTAELENPYILIVDKKITTIKEILPILNTISQEGAPLFIIAEDIDTEPLATLVVNKLRMLLKVCAVKSPGFGDRRKQLLEDIATTTGATLISEEKGYKLEKVTKEQLGRAEKVKVDKEETIIIGGAGTESNIQARIQAIENELNNTDSDYEREKLQERLGKMTGGVGIINVGAPTELEMKETKDRVVDALNATKAAIEEGVVPGGGIALLVATKSLENISTEYQDEITGIKIIQKAIQEPLKVILQNALGKDNYYPTLQKIKEGQKEKEDYGYDARNHKFGSLYSLGVLDPAKVTKLALESAASIIGLLIRVTCAVADKPEEDKGDNSNPAMGADMSGMM